MVTHVTIILNAFNTWCVMRSSECLAMAICRLHNVAYLLVPSQELLQGRCNSLSLPCMGRLNFPIIVSQGPYSLHTCPPSSFTRTWHCTPSHSCIDTLSPHFTAEKNDGSHASRDAGVCINLVPAANSILNSIPVSIPLKKYSQLDPANT